MSAKTWSIELHSTSDSLNINYSAQILKAFCLQRISVVIIYTVNPLNVWIRSCLYEKNHPTQVRHLTWVRSRQNGQFHFVKVNRLYENGFIPPRWDLTLTRVRSHLGGMIFLLVSSFCQADPPRQDCSLSLDSVCFYIYYLKKCNSSYKI